MTLLSRRPGVLGTALDLLLVHGPAVLLCACCLLTLGSLACACLCWCWRRCCSCLPSLSGLGLLSLGLSSLGLGLSSVGLACGARALASVSVRLLLPRLAWRMACLCSLGRFQHMVCLHTRGGLPPAVSHGMCKDLVQGRARITQHTAHSQPACQLASPARLGCLQPTLPVDRLFPPCPPASDASGLVPVLAKPCPGRGTRAGEHRTNRTSLERS